MTVCDSCHNFKLFGEKCWYYWKNKRTCTQHRKTAESAPDFYSEELVLRL